MIAGCACFFRCGMKSAERCTGASKLIAISSCVGFHFRSSGSWTRRWMPALLTRTLRRGNSFVTHLWSAARWVSLARSQTRVLSPGCFARASASFSSRRPQMITSLPALRNRSASAKPIPDAPPVIRTVFEASCMEDPFVVVPAAPPPNTYDKELPLPPATILPPWPGAVDQPVVVDQMNAALVSALASSAQSSTLMRGSARRSNVASRSKAARLYVASRARLISPRAR